MLKIGLLSDTHAWWDDKYAEYFAECDEIWHAGDIGSDGLAAKLAALKPFRAIRKELYDTRPNLFIAGHSHILKVAFDQSLNCLYINPGAAGKSGFHQVRTLIRFVIDGKNIKDLEVIELGIR